MRWYGFVAVALLLCCLVGCSRSKEAWRRDQRWQFREWTADETPYQKIAASVEELKKAPVTTDRDPLYERIVELKKEKPSSLRAFEILLIELSIIKRERKIEEDRDWGKKSWRVSSANGVDIDGNIKYAHEHGDFTSYPMVRTRYVLAGSTSLAFFYGSPDLAERLLKRNPKDFDVSVVYANVLSRFYSDLTSQKRRYELMKPYCDRLDDSRGLYHCSGAAYRIWKIDQTRENADLASELLTRYLHHPRAARISVKVFGHNLEEIKAWRK